MHRDVHLCLWLSQIVQPDWRHWEDVLLEMLPKKLERRSGSLGQAATNAASWLLFCSCFLLAKQPASQPEVPPAAGTRRRRTTTRTARSEQQQQPRTTHAAAAWGSCSVLAASGQAGEQEQWWLTGWRLIFFVEWSKLHLDKDSILDLKFAPVGFSST